MVIDDPALVDLEARAGASDQDRELWLAERLTGVTATEVRDLMIKGASFRRELLAEKAVAAVFKDGKTTSDSAKFKRGRAFIANQYTAWGKKREPVIAEWVQTRFAIAPESRVFHAADDSRKLASPDGVGVAFDGTLVVSEIKTSKHDIAPGTDHFDSTGYLLQMTWAMRVTGARRCLYVWEQHDDDWRDVGGDYLEPSPLGEPLYQWFAYDEVIAAKLEKVAVGFLAELDEARRALDAGEATLIDDEIDTLGFNVLQFRDREASAKRSKEQVWKELQTAAAAKGKSFSQESLLARVTYSITEASESEVPDVEAAKAADPELWESLEILREQWAEHQAKFTKKVPVAGKATLTVTSPKLKELSA
jgi:hypothetical protein